MRCDLPPTPPSRPSEERPHDDTAHRPCTCTAPVGFVIADELGILVVVSLISAAIQGEIGSFHHTATLQLLGEDTVIVPRQTFSEVFETLQLGRVNYAVVAVENSSYGPIQEVHDLLKSYRFKTHRQLWLPIEQCLLGLSDTSLERITAVYSHPVALAQCQNFLQTTLSHAKQIAHADTAGAANEVSRWQDPSKAAIAGASMIEYTNLSVLVPRINDQPDNRTRFLLLSQ